MDKKIGLVTEIESSWIYTVYLSYITTTIIILTTTTASITTIHV